MHIGGRKKQAEQSGSRPPSSGLRKNASDSVVSEEKRDQMQLTANGSAVQAAKKLKTNNYVGPLSNVTNRVEVVNKPSP